jgi:hypothetical protein
LVYSGIGLDRFLVYSGFGLGRFLVYSGFGLDSMFLDVGTVPGGADVLNQFSLGGPKTEVDEVFYFQYNLKFQSLGFY